MTAKPTNARVTADRAASMMSRIMAEPEPEVAPIDADTTEPEAPTDPASTKRPPGRPRGKREVAARQTVNLDPARYDALNRLAEDRGRSVHSLILEGIDHVIGKPQRPGWAP